MFTCDVASEPVDPRSNGRAGHGKIKREASEREQGGRIEEEKGGGEGKRGIGERGGTRKRRKYESTTVR